jgi:photosystem II stability/assembly factor-like uncharacterized protein
MPDLKRDEIVTAKHKRTFLQIGDARPNKPVSYAGQDAQYISVTGVSNPESGGIDPIYVHDPRRPGKYRLVGRTVSPADLPSATVVFREKHGIIPRALLKSCPFNVYEPTGTCKDLSDFLAGWSDYVLIYAGGEVTDKDLGDRSPFDSDDAIENSLSVTWRDIYPVGALGFGEGATTQVDREVIDLVYAPGYLCADCDWGDQRIYAIATTSGGGSPGLPAEVIYSSDGGATWSQVNIDGMGATEAPLAVDIVGNYLVVIGSGAYYFAEINAKTGVPAAFTKVTTGFVAAKNPTDLFVASPREVYFSALGGYIYKSTDITSGVSVLNAGSATTQNLNRIHGVENTIVAVGASGVVVKTNNRGATWAATSAVPEVSTLQAVQVLSDDRYWVGSSATGRLFWTQDGGEVWTQKRLPGVTDGSGGIYDIVFASQEVGYVSYSNTTPTATLYATWNGGADWAKSAPRILNWPTLDRANRIAVPATDDAGWASNAVAIAGLAGDGSDGIILVGVAGKQ